MEDKRQANTEKGGERKLICRQTNIYHLDSLLSRMAEEEAEEVGEEEEEKGKRVPRHEPCFG